MTIRAPSHDRLATMAADIRQLVAPIHAAVQRRVVTHPPLLDSLRDACQPGRGPDTGRRTPPGSRPPIRLDTVDALSEIYVGISRWHARLSPPSPPRDTDWQKAALRAFVGAAPNLAPSLADYLADEVYEWWRLAAIGSGWRPEHLRKLR